MSADSSRDAILRVGTEAIYEKGYNPTGLMEILAAAGVPKGSFYHYFSNKEDFGLQVVEHYKSDFDAFFDFHLRDHALPPLERLRNFFEASIERLAGRGFRGGCLVGNVGQEMGDQSPAFSEKVESVFISWRDRFVPVLKEARERGELPADTDCLALADFLWNSWEGAMLRMKVTKSEGPLRTFVDHVFNAVLKA